MTGQTPPFWKGWQGSRVLLSRLLSCALFWYVLSGGRTDSWIVGVPAVLAAALVSAAMLPPVGISLPGLARFVRFFLRESLLGGLDVARRAVHWRMPLDPGIVVHGNRTRGALARAAVSNTACLLPGTLVVDLDGGDTWVHALDTGREVRESLELSEVRVADMLGLTLERPETDRRLG